MAEEKFGIAFSELGKSTIMPPVTVYIPMPPGAAVPAQAAQPQNSPAQAPTDSSQGTR
jgi:hypothetical protein